MKNLNLIKNQCLPSPVQEIQDPLLEKHKIQLLIKRDDLVHPTVSGNKWRKLVGNIEFMKAQGLSGIISFGGAFSNHIYALAAMANILDVPCVGIIRGEYDIQNPTLAFAKSQGMKLHYVSRSAYRAKENDPTIMQILSQYHNYFLIPEGGSNEHAYIGLKALADELKPVSYDILTVAAGTGTTSAGLIIHQDKKVEVSAVLKGDFLKQHISNIVGNRLFDYINDCHLGGYAKTNETYISWLNQFYEQHHLPLDPIYNGKVLYGLFRRIEEGCYSPGSTILHIHTGGLQGMVAYNFLAAKTGIKLQISQ